MVVCNSGPGLAALTWWLRLQVVTFIAGRSFTTNYMEELEELTNNLLGADKYNDVKVGNMITHRVVTQ